MGKTKILLAEAESIQAAYMRSLLERNGWKADVVKGTNKLLQKLGGGEYGVVLLNSNFSGKGKHGVELVEQIQEQARLSGHQISIILLANYSYDLERKKFQQAGVEHCLTKPIYKQHLLAALNNVLQHSRLPNA